MRNLHQLRRALLVLASVLVVMMGWGLGAEARRARAKTKAAVPGATSDCKTDADCVSVPDDCCGCEQGGKQHAIPKKQKDAYDKDRKKRCAKTECIEMMSQDPSCSQHAFCGAGICELGG
jgi:hypothetical protein